jgi:hypothetical protein
MNVFSLAQCQEILCEFDAFDQKNDENTSEFYKDSVGAYDLPATMMHVDRLTAQVQEMFPGAVFENTYTRSYSRGSYLKIHTDREGLDITMSVCLEKTTPAAYPLYVSKVTHEKEWDSSVDTAPYTSSFSAYDMPAGMGVVMEGRKYPHWRDALDCKDGERAVYAFYHWKYAEQKPKQKSKHVPALVLKNPEVSLYNNFLSDVECALLIWMSNDRLKRSQVVDNQSGGEYVDPNRSSHGTYFTVQENAVVANIERRISEITGYPVENGEGIQILRYEEGQEYRPHFDYFDPNSPAISNQLTNNRVCTFLMYLNTPEEGGETVFPDAGLSVRAKQGSALQFSYKTPTPDTKTLHAGSPVTKGEKWVATKWIRRKEYK